MKTKEKIEWASLDMFNSEGVEKVTTRHIAKSIGISQGNLHYHYPNKNAIISALYKQFFARLEQARRYNPHEFFKKENVLASMMENYDIMHTYRFFFIDNEVIWRRLPQLKSNMIDLFEMKQEEIKQLIIQYREHGVFRPDISDPQIDYLAEQFVFTITSWLSASSYIRGGHMDNEHYAKFTFRMWLPYLTMKAMKEWEGIL